LSAQNPSPEALLVRGPRVASDSLVASHRRSGTNDKRALGVESVAVPLAGDHLAGCHWQAWLLAAQALCPGTEKAEILRVF
jgi:hypothetical protein